MTRYRFQVQHRVCRRAKRANEFSRVSSHAPSPGCAIKSAPRPPPRDSLATDHLWCRVIRTPTTRLQEIPIRHDITQSKVADLDVEIIVE
jgi:hypothetical protein